MDEYYVVLQTFEFVFFWSLWCTGVFLNTVLLVVFIRHPETRTPENILLINLCVADLAYLLSFALKILVIGFDIVGAYSFMYYSSFCVALGILSIVAIGIQRYFGISKFRNRLNVGGRSYTKSLMALMGVWILAASFAGLEIYFISLRCEFPCINYMIFGEETFRLLVYGFIPCGIITEFYSVTSCLIRRSAHQIPGVESDALAAFRKRRKQSAGIVTAVSLSFYLTYLPLFVCLYLYKMFNYQTNWLFVVHFSLARIFSVLNPVANPVALFKTSIQLKQLMKNYFCYCCDRLRASRMPESIELI